MKRLMLILSLVFGILIFKFSLDQFDIFIDVNRANVGVDEQTNNIELYMYEYNLDDNILDYIVDFVLEHKINAKVTTNNLFTNETFIYVYAPSLTNEIPLKQGNIYELKDFDKYSTNSNNNSTTLYNPLVDESVITYLPFKQITELSLSEVSHIEFNGNDKLLVEMLVSKLAAEFPLTDFSLMDYEVHLYEFSFYEPANIEILIAGALFLTLSIVAYINRETKSVSMYKIEGHNLSFLYRNIVLKAVFHCIIRQLLSIISLTILLIPFHIDKTFLFKSAIIYFSSLNLALIVISLISLVFLSLIPINLMVKGKNYLLNTEIALRVFKLISIVLFSTSILSGLNYLNNYRFMLQNDKEAQSIYENVYVLNGFSKPNIEIYQSEAGKSLQQDLEVNDDLFMFLNRREFIEDNDLEVYFVTKNYFKLNEIDVKNNTIVANNQASLDQYCAEDSDSDVLDEQYCQNFQKLVLETKFINYDFQYETGLYLDKNSVLVVSEHPDIDYFVNRYFTYEKPPYKNILMTYI